MSSQAVPAPERRARPAGRLFRHANPDLPIPTRVSTYGRLYNTVFMNKGYHAEHHHRPKQHWTKMHALKLETLVEQQAARVRVLRAPHFLGFLDPAARRAPTAMKRRLAIALLAVAGASLALAGCDQKRSIYLDPGHDPDRAVQHSTTPAKSAPAPEVKPAQAAGHKS
jgi:hypothetical protein